MGAGARDPVPVAVFAAPEKYGTWNPGLESELPHDYLPLSSMFRAFRTEDVSTSIAKA
jgi:hypothetical protein